MRDRIEERCQKIADYVIEKKATVRQAAQRFCISKSTVHKDLIERLPEVNFLKSQMVRMVLDQNKAERHIRGGMATKMKYRSKK